MVILAGGEGSRIGGGKPSRMLGGETLLDRAVAKARGWSDDLRLSLRTAGQVRSPALSVILDESAVEGPLAALASALRAGKDAQKDAILTLPCDMPFLPDDLAGRLISDIGAANAALASSKGQIHPVCGLWRVRCLDALPGYVASGRRSLKGFAEAVDFVSVEWPDDPFFNINDADDLAEAERRLRS